MGTVASAEAKYAASERLAQAAMAKVEAADEAPPFAPPVDEEDGA